MFYLSNRNKKTPKWIKVEHCEMVIRSTKFKERKKCKCPYDDDYTYKIN